MNPRHPMQPLIRTQEGTVRFKQNAIVRHLLDKGGIDMNMLARMDFTQDDRQQFAQLIGYSLSGFHELSYVSDVVAKQASEEARKQWPDTGGCRDDGCEWHCGVKDESDSPCDGDSL